MKYINLDDSVPTPMQIGYKEDNDNDGWAYDPNCGCCECQEFERHEEEAYQKDLKVNPMYVPMNFREYLTIQQNSANLVNYSSNMKNGNGENSMNYNTKQDLEVQQRQYLKERASRTLNEKLSDLQAQFGLADEKAPTTAKEFFDRIKEGRYVLPERIEKETSISPYAIVDYIRWRDPSVQKDNEGYEKAAKLLDNEFIKVKDAVMVKHLDDALAAVTEFDKYPN